MLQWTEQFETGHAQIDYQHKMLIGYINQLEGMSRITNPSRQEVEFILKLVDFVESYTVEHFQNEEGCMARHRCPSYQQNKAAHDKFLQFFRSFKQRFGTEGCRPEVIQELHDACSSWIQEHILQIDVKLKDCLSAGGATASRST
jgi:hemerythrin